MEQTPKKKGLWKNGLLVLLILVAIVSIISSIGNPKEIFNKIVESNKLYLSAAIILAVIYTLIMSLSNQIVLRSLDEKLPYLDGMLIFETEYFFNAITPFSSGAQPFQAYMFIKKEVDAKNVTSILVVNFILYQTTLILMLIGAMIFFGGRIINALGSSSVYVLIGFVINIVILVFLFLVSYVKGFAKVIKKGFSWIGKIKKLEPKMTELTLKTDDFVHKYQESVKILFNRKAVFIKSFFLKAVALSIQFGIPVIIAYALGQKIVFNDIIYITLITSLSVTAMIWIPLPGASGGTEWAFAALMAPIFMNQKDLVLAILLLWRFITYYFPLMLGFIAYLWSRKRTEKQQELEESIIEKDI